MADTYELRVPFVLRSLEGSIDVALSPNTNPEGMGYLLLSGGVPVDFAQGYPVCRASISYPGDGYAAVFGWTQMVTSTENDHGFEMDPIAIYSEVPTPFAWYGLKPTLFDAPSRYRRTDMEWLAHSFLCVTPDAVISRQVQAVAGFSWGFKVANDKITLTAPGILDEGSWTDHLRLLAGGYPAWNFEPGYRSG